MNTNLNRPLLVIVANWNPAIVLDSNWLGRYIFPGLKELNVSIGFKDGELQPPYIKLPMFRMSMEGNRLLFRANEFTEEIFQSIENAVFKLADFLPHTPVTAFGVNFEFNEDRKLLCVDTIRNGFLSCFQDLYNLQETQTIYTFKAISSTINFTVKEVQEKVSFGINCHRNIKSLADLKGQLGETSIEDHLTFAESLIKKLLEQRAVEDE